MTNLMIQIVEGAILGVLLYFTLKQLEKTWKTLKELKKVGDSYAQLKLANEGTVCKGPHAWDQFELAFSQIPIGMHSVCKDCGFVGGTGYQLNGVGLEILKNHLVRRAVRTEIQAQFDKQRQQAYYDAGLSALMAVRLDVALEKINKDQLEALNKV